MKSLFPKAHLGLENLFAKKFKHHTFHIDCRKLIDCDSYIRSTRHSGEAAKLFRCLDKIKTPIIYWFEVEDEKEAKRQLKLAESYRTKQKRAKKDKRRVMPLPNGKINSKSNVLYVGKRQGGISKKEGFTHAADRMEMHLGYNPKGANQGMQLVHWCDCNVTVNILELPKDAGPYLTTLEQLFAIEKAPYLGRH